VVLGVQQKPSWPGETDPWSVHTIPWTPWLKVGFWSGRAEPLQE
jgi:hypothetical protein